MTMNGAHPDNAKLATAYRLISELFLYPEVRDTAQIKRGMDALGGTPGPLLDTLQAFNDDPSSQSLDEYVATLELSPPCPLSLGAYLFDEPQSCRGAGMSGRNTYMIELNNIYRHFGFELNGTEVSDFLPVMVEFLAISALRRQMDDIGLRRSFIERYLVPGLDPLSEALKKYDSPYALLVSALRAVLADDIAISGDQPAWLPPVDEPPRQATCSIRLEAAFPSAGKPTIEAKP